ncbi:MAG TPA: tetratricopeptide repeat protein, partial [Burkholderiaceae bacterium]|nr:tetratricopeptide repeat protein [Burkholderiaceae bacterium]
MHDATFTTNGSADFELSQRLELAYRAHRSGHLLLAREHYVAVLAARPSDALALAGLGAALAQSGDLEEAIGLLESAVTLSQGAQAAAPLANLGNALQATGRPRQAMERFEQALCWLPGNPDLLVNRGNCLRLMDRRDDAAASYRAALRSSPLHAQANEALGVLEHERGQSQGAVQFLEAAVRAAPQSASAWYNLGVVQMALARPQMAVDAYARALALQPSNASLQHNHSLALKALDRDQEALAHVDQAIALQPDQARFHASRGHLLWKLKHREAALASYRASLDLQPLDSTVWLALADSLRMQRRYRESIHGYEQSLALAPEDPAAAKAHFNLATCQLRLGDYAAGWKNFEWRWGDAEITPPHRFPIERLWVGGEGIAGRRLLVHSEQGFGDVIQFSRFLPLLAEQGARVWFEVAPPMAALMRCVCGADRIVPMGQGLPEYDRHIPLLSLPLALRIEANAIASEAPYLWAPKDRLATWEMRLGSHHRLRVGLAW